MGKDGGRGTNEAVGEEVGTSGLLCMIPEGMF